MAAALLGSITAAAAAPPATASAPVALVRFRFLALVRGRLCGPVSGRRFLIQPEFAFVHLVRIVVEIIALAGGRRRLQRGGRRRRLRQASLDRSRFLRAARRRRGRRGGAHGGEADYDRVAGALDDRFG
ncbi:MAG: hypothetical protein HZB38_17590 [Planctomycetes bacterium]|nr:hypothetical protein [Planctomycetota bacterium]